MFSSLISTATAFAAQVPQMPLESQARYCKVIYTNGAPRLGHRLRERSGSFGATCPAAIGGFV